MRQRTLASYLVVVLVAGCPGPAEPSGGGQVIGQTLPPVAGAERPPSVDGPTERASPWATLTSADLARLVDEQARARLREAQPDLDLAQLDAILDAPDRAPELKGRAVERLLDVATVFVVRNELDKAKKTIRLVRARARNRNSAWAATTLLSEIERRQAGSDTAAEERAIAGVLRELPRPRFGSATVVFQIYQNGEQLTAHVAELKEQMLALETASSVLFFGEILSTVVANRDRFLAAIDTVRREHEAARAEREYRFSTVDLSRARDAHDIVVAVWDTGTNTELFSRQLFTNPGEQPNGRDDDGNGIVDDVHGIVADGDAPSTALLFDPGRETIERYSGYARGIMDLRAGLASSPAAQRVLELVRAATNVQQLKALDRNLDAIGEWAHGTHVAGILVAGNPHARLAAFRSAWAGETRVYYERGPTDEELARERANVDAIVAFVNRHEVRVVNASIGFSTDYLEDQLRHESARYRTAEEVRARAQAVQQRRREAFQSVFDRCPRTLFVVAAGNSNRDVVEYEEVPAAQSSPNLLAVGAVDKYGGWATFTNSSPERVHVFDLGVEVDSVIPNGERVPFSGTSMASPNAANLASKMFAVDPALTPERAIRIITETADPIAAPFNGRIANEQRALARVRRERGRARPPAGNASTPAGSGRTPAAGTAPPRPTPGARPSSG